MSVNISEGGSGKQTAASLSIHRHTLHCRLEHLSHRFSIDLTDSGMWTQHQVSCSIVQIMNH
ncbi:MAG: PucR family transcriptional regulator [Erysipelotrichia bacterium]|nr:PucR family transcriptional regulator [Erysipelotrichia bacterium]